MLRFTENPGGIRIGGVTPGGIATSEGKIWPPDATPPTPAAYHTYTITVAVTGSGVIVGYWDNNAGSIADATYQLPNGRNALIRQTMGGTATAIRAPLHPNPMKCASCSTNRDLA